MKGGTLQITWHGSDPVLTLDFDRISGLLATGGADHDIKMWSIHQEDDAMMPSATFQCSLSYHSAAVNIVRFSLAGDQLASGADGGEVLLWKLHMSSETSNTWKLARSLRFHVKDVLDLEWSPDGMSLVSGSVDNSVIIWDCIKGIPQQILKDHMHYVQGVAWDPSGQYIASLSSDRTCRIYSFKNPTKSSSKEKGIFVCRNVLAKVEAPNQEVPKREIDHCNSKVLTAKQYLFHDETLPSFFRRLSWSPDGSFLLVPSGVHKFPRDSVLCNTAFIFSRKDLSRPCLQLPGASKPVVAVRFCPLMFSLQPNVELQSENETTATQAFKLPYRIIFALATLNSIYLYDTQSSYPLGVLAGVHYAAITDIAWSWDAKFLAVSSQDGFCTLISFSCGELGNPLPSNDLPSHVAKYMVLAKERVTSKPNKCLSEPRDVQKVQQSATDLNLVAVEDMTPTKEMASCSTAEVEDVGLLNMHRVSFDKPPVCNRHGVSTLPTGSAEPGDLQDVESHLAMGVEKAMKVKKQGIDSICDNKNQEKKPRRITPVPITGNSKDGDNPSQKISAEITTDSNVHQHGVPTLPMGSAEPRDSQDIESILAVSVEKPMRANKRGIESICDSKSQEKKPWRVTPVPIPSNLKDGDKPSQEISAAITTDCNVRQCRQICPVAIIADSKKEDENLLAIPAESNGYITQRIGPFVITDGSGHGDKVSLITSAASIDSKDGDKPQLINPVAIAGDFENGERRQVSPVAIAAGSACLQETPDGKAQ